ncbi:MAG: ribosome maturation factor RimP [Azonexus sp.]|nr:ribosome maturation factor RimP [Azonexus sp.]
MDLNTLIETTVVGLGYELVDVEMSPRGRTVRVYIDLPGDDKGIDVEDCAKVSNQLSRVFEVENIDFDHLEISSPGLDRVVKKAEDFERFAGQEIQIKLRIPHGGRRNFQGELLGCKDGKVSLRLAKDDAELEFNNIEKARLVPRFD